MDLSIRDFAGSENGIELGNQPLSFISDLNFVVGPSFENNFIDPGFFLEPDTTQSSVVTSSILSHEDDDPEDSDFSDVVLKYIGEMLMEEDMEYKACMLQDSLALQAAEKSLYDVIGKKYPQSPKEFPNYESQNGKFSGNHSNYASSASDSGSDLVDNSWIRNISGGYNTSQAQDMFFIVINSHCLAL